jgi:hypothetical protein
MESSSVKVTTVCVQPPIPIRDYDWCAYDASTYDGADDAKGQIVGWGATEEAAVLDFNTQWSDIHDICEHGKPPTEKCNVCDTH